jgi:hypothetical protein
MGEVVFQEIWGAVTKKEGMNAKQVNTRGIHSEVETLPW